MSHSKSDFTADEYEIKLLLAKSRFQRDVLELRNKWDIPPQGHPNNRELNGWKENKSEDDNAKFQRDLYSLINDYKLSERWVIPLKQYVLDNIATRLRATPYTEWKFDYEGDTSDPKNIQAVWIKVDADSTQREITDAFKQAKTMLPAKRKKQAYTYLDHAIKAKELKKPDIKWSEVTKRVNEEFGTNYDENYVIKLVSRLDKHL